MTNETDDQRMQRLSKDQYERPLPKRFFKDVSVTPEHGIALDGRVLKTPLKHTLIFPCAALAEAAAGEWRAQEKVINPGVMPITKLGNTALDRTPLHRTTVIEEIVQYAGNDLVCYRADRPPELVALQKRHWDPVVAWGAVQFGTAWRVTDSIVHIDQEASNLNNLRAEISTLGDFKLTGIQHLTTSLGSALIATMLLNNAIMPEAAWLAANAEEDYQVSNWGWDREAETRRKYRALEFDATVMFLALS